MRWGESSGNLDVMDGRADREVETGRRSEKQTLWMGVEGWDGKRWRRERKERCARRGANGRSTVIEG